MLIFKKFEGQLFDFKPKDVMCKTRDRLKG